MEEQAAVLVHEPILEDEERAGPVRTVKAETTVDGSPAFVYLDGSPEIFTEDEFKCPICLGPLDKTFATMGCLHRFCCECLQRALRVDLGDNAHHSCPSCRGKLASRRASNHDVRFDFLMNEIVNATKAPSVERQQQRLQAEQEQCGAVQTGSGRAQRRTTFSKISPRSDKVVEVKIDIKTYRAQHQANVEKLRERARIAHEVSQQQRMAAALQGMVHIGIHHVSHLGDDFPSITGAPRLARSARQVALETIRMPYLKLPPHASIKDLKSYLINKLAGNTFHTIVTKQQAHMARELLSGRNVNLAVATSDDVMESSASLGLASTNQRKVTMRELSVETLDLGLLCRGHMILCEDSYTVKYICQHVWDRASPLILYFDAVWKTSGGFGNPFEQEDDEEEDGGEVYEEAMAAVTVAAAGSGGGGGEDLTGTAGAMAWRPPPVQQRRAGDGNANARGRPRKPTPRHLESTWGGTAGDYLSDDGEYENDDRISSDEEEKRRKKRKKNPPTGKRKVKKEQPAPAL